MFKQYVNRGNLVWVREDLEGKHAEHSLCGCCERYIPTQEDNCPIALRLRSIRSACGVITPVWECPAFKEK